MLDIIFFQKDGPEKFVKIEAGKETQPPVLLTLTLLSLVCKPYFPGGNMGKLIPTPGKDLFWSSNDSYIKCNNF